MKLAAFSALLLAFSANSFATDTIFTGDTQVFAQVVDGGSWKTTITLLNLGNNTATYALNFYVDDGKALQHLAMFNPVHNGLAHRLDFIHRAIPDTR